MIDLSSINVVSYNVNGLRSMDKRRTIFNFLKAQNSHLILLQETQSTPEIEKVWSNEWGSRIFFAHGTNMSRGVALLVERNMPVQVEYSVVDPEGRYLILDVSFQELKFILVSVYAPNEDDPNFFVRLFAEIDKRENDSMILMGDFNTSLNPDIDLYNNVGANHIRKREIILNYMEERALTDIWRIKHPEDRVFSWRKPNSRVLIMSRLDFALVSQDLALRTNKAEIKPRFLSDHCRVVINLDFTVIERGKGYWKFNNLLLQDKEFVSQMNDLIVIFLYEVKNINEIDLVTQWETLKIKITNFAKEYSKKRARVKNTLIESFERRIITLEKRLIQSNDVAIINKTLRDIQNTEQFLLNEYEDRVKAACFRSKANYYLEGGKNSKYFFNLEKS